MLPNMARLIWNLNSGQMFCSSFETRDFSLNSLRLVWEIAQDERLGQTLAGPVG